ncbi:hypothetical protein D9M71_204220 [compost metagenome]
MPALAPRAGGQPPGIEEQHRLAHRYRRAWRRLRGDEGRQPGGLLLGGGPTANAVGGRQWCQQCGGQAQVALGQGLGHEGIGLDGALAGQPTQRLNDAIVRQAQFMGLVEQPGGQRAAGVGIMGGGAQGFQGKGVQHVHQHALLVGQRQVEQLVRVGLARHLARTPGGQQEAGAGAAVEEFFEGLAQLQAIGPVGLGHAIQHGQGAALGIGIHRHRTPCRMRMPR